MPFFMFVRLLMLAFTPTPLAGQGLSVQDYEAKKELMAEQLIDRMEAILPGLKAGIVYKEVRGGRWWRPGTAGTHCRNRMLCVCGARGRGAGGRCPGLGARCKVQGAGCTSGCARCPGLHSCHIRSCALSPSSSCPSPTPTCII